MTILPFHRIRRIMIRSTNWIGDAVMTTPAMQAVKASFPNAETVLVANPVVAELFLFHPCCDGVIVYDKKGAHRGLTGLYRFSRELRKERFDLALLFQNAMEAAVLAFLARIPVRAGYRSDGRGPLLTHGVPLDPYLLRLHHTRYYLEMLSRLGIRGGDGRLVLACSDEELARADALLGQAKWAAVCPGAAYGSAKRWLPERFAAVADDIAREFSLKILLLGGPAEKPLGHDIARAMKEPVLNLIGETTVRRMTALLAGCSLVVTNDSGPMHVAAAFNIPTAALFGPTDPNITSPWSSRHRIVRHPVDCAPCRKRTCHSGNACMDAIGVEDVMNAVRELLL